MKRITRLQAKDDLELLFEVEAFNPFVTNKEISRSPHIKKKAQAESSNLHKSSSESDIQSLEQSQNSFDVHNNTTVQNFDPLINLSEENNTPTTSKGLFHSTPYRKTVDFSNISEIDKNLTIRPIIPVTNQQEFDMSLEENPPAIMALPFNQTVSLVDAIKVVPEFDGSNIPVTLFIRGCYEAKDMIGQGAEGNLTKLLRSKILGEAQETISGQTFETVEALSNFLKDIYIVSRTVKQLLGDLGNEYQREDEKVITFANRIRDIGTRIIEAQRAATGNADNQFIIDTQNDVIETFREGLLPEIEIKMVVNRDMNELIKNAIKIERKLATQKSRITGSTVESKITRKKEIFTCQLCKKGGHVATDCSNLSPIPCEICKKTNHTRDQCFFKDKKPTTTCQICNRPGHEAPQCFKIQNCQICQQVGHTAKFCSQTKSSINCQICRNSGHDAKNCPQIKQNEYCHFCKTNSHSTDDCKMKGKTNNPMVARSQFQCQLCNGIGHTAARCKNLGVNNDLEEFCNYCKEKGHVIQHCIKRTINNFRKSGNGNGLQISSAKVETLVSPGRSPKMMEVENLPCE